MNDILKSALSSNPPLMESVSARLESIKNTVLEIKPSINSGKFDLVAVDWAGIGDACCHSRLILQHLHGQGHRIAWITIPKVAELFKDDVLFDIFPGFSCPYRDVSLPWCGEVAKEIDGLLGVFSPTKLHISMRVFDQWAIRRGISNYSEFFFSACSVKRDSSIKHEIRHLGKPTIALPNKFVCLENIGMTCGSISQEACAGIVSAMGSIGVSVVCMGSKDNPYVNGCVDARGLSLYDSFSVVKNSIGIIGKSSGNQSLFCFLPDLPIFEVDVPECASYRDCRLSNRVTKVTACSAARVMKEYFGGRA